MKLFGLIGYPLTHSFSKKYFTQKFEKENITDCQYELFEIPEASQITDIIKNNADLNGLNVTIPHKEAVIPFINELDEPVKSIGAVNVIKVMPDKKLKGFNSDYHGFRQSLLNFLPENFQGIQALVLGTGGASKAVVAALNDLHIPCKLVSRTSSGSAISYEEASELCSDYKLIINTSPLGMYPKTDTCPDLPYNKFDSSYYLFDLVYNPEETLFMKKGLEQGANVRNGLEMLILQAEKAWEIWNS
jgi:shikimate dehydrogenase